MRRWGTLFLLLVLAVIKLVWVDNIALQQLLSRYTAATNRQIVNRVNTKETLIALTFEDGPDPTYTPLILDILAAYDVKATFFVTGRQVQSWPEHARRIAAEGHELANHTYHHPHISELVGDRLYTEILATTEAIRNVSGKKTTLIRPPEGEVNDELLEMCFDLGYTIVNWTPHLNSYDLLNPDQETLVTHLCNYACEGGIILLHDRGGDRELTIAALPELIEKLQAAGYELVSVSEMIQRSKRPIWLPESY